MSSLIFRDCGDELQRSSGGGGEGVCVRSGTPTAGGFVGARSLLAALAGLLKLPLFDRRPNVPVEKGMGCNRSMVASSARWCCEVCGGAGVSYV